ncbi:S8 family serine peptidase [Kitasatospora sp. NPDC006697]|uniref:S8 family serine peptidase n=1 Tax=Kitasatospora sp. NPDC006697 TaxID=3364020 RepID=UPI0036A93352
MTDGSSVTWGSSFTLPSSAGSATVLSPPTSSTLPGLPSSPTLPSSSTLLSSPSPLSLPFSPFPPASNRVRLAGSALAALLLLAAGPAAGTAWADDPSPAPSSLPGIAQQRGGSDKGCVPAATAPVTAVPWPQTFLRPDQAWPLSQGAGVTVAVLGSGVDDASGALGNRLTRAARLAGGGGDPARDCVGHGTFVADLIAAGHRDGTGFTGIAPAAKVLAVGVTDDTGATNATLLAAGLRAAADGGARVICVAATVPAGTDALRDAVRYAVGKGALVVAPAAADSGQQQPLAAAYPAAYPEALAVRDLAPGGTTPANTAYAGRVDLAAPGDAVMSHGPGGPGYATASGPSFAAAFTAGTAALVLARTPDLTAAQLTRRLLATAYPSAVPTLDLVAAVTQLPTTAGAVAPTPTTLLTMPTPPPRSPAPAQAATIALGAFAVTLLTGATAVVIPRARRRRRRLIGKA